MIRFCGAVLFLASAICVGILMRKNESRHIAALTDALEIVAHVRRKIDLFGTPLGELFTDYPEDKALSRRLSAMPLAEALQPLMNAMESDAEILLRFCTELGGGYREDTLKLCDYTTEVLTARLGYHQKEYPAHAKLYVTLPVLLALSVILLFA